MILTSQQPKEGINHPQEDDSLHNKASSTEEGREHVVDIDEGFDPKLIRRVTRKVDFRLVTVLILMYSMCVLDRANMGYARQANKAKMDKELGTGGNNTHYSTVTAVYFVPYIILEIPSQYGLRAFGPRFWLGSVTVLWGVVQLCMAFVTNWKQLAGLRVLLGAFESAMFPGAAYMISCWYPRRNMALRTSIFYMSSSLIASLSIPLGYTYSLLDGRLNRSGWSWMFIFYGVWTILSGCAALLFLVDVPQKAKFLTKEEREMWNTRIERDRADSVEDPMTTKKLVDCLCDWKLWLFGIFFMSINLSINGQAYFMPVILSSMGFGYVQSMCLPTPTHVWGLIPTFTFAYISDHYPGMRGLMLMFSEILNVIGTSMYAKLPAHQKAARYAGLFLAAGSANGSVGLLVSWASANVRMQSKRAVSSALILLWGGIGGIMACYTMINKEAKKGYPTGIDLNLALNAFVVVGSGLLSLFFRYRNRQADKGLIVLEGDENFRYQS